MIHVIHFRFSFYETKVYKKENISLFNYYCYFAVYGSSSLVVLSSISPTLLSHSTFTQDTIFFPFRNCLSRSSSQVVTLIYTNTCTAAIYMNLNP